MSQAHTQTKPQPIPVSPAPDAKKVPVPLDANLLRQVSGGFRAPAAGW